MKRVTTQHRAKLRIQATGHDVILESKMCLDLLDDLFDAETKYQAIRIEHWELLSKLAFGPQHRAEFERRLSEQRRINDLEKSNATLLKLAQTLVMEIGEGDPEDAPAPSADAEELKAAHERLNAVWEAVNKPQTVYSELYYDGEYLSAFRAGVAAMKQTLINEVRRAAGVTA